MLRVHGTWKFIVRAPRCPPAPEQAALGAMSERSKPLGNIVIAVVVRNSGEHNGEGTREGSGAEQ